MPRKKKASFRAVRSLCCMALYGFDNYVVIHKKLAFKYSLNVNLILLLTSHPKEINKHKVRQSDVQSYVIMWTI